MSDRAAERARLCFKLARDERTPPGERQAALDRGLAILQRAQLNPDHFDIPGRTRREAPTFSPDRLEWLRAQLAAGHPLTMDDLVREAVREAMRRRHFRP